MTGSRGHNCGPDRRPDSDKPIGKPADMPIGKPHGVAGAMRADAALPQMANVRGSWRRASLGYGSGLLGGDYTCISRVSGWRLRRRCWRQARRWRSGR